MISKFILPLLGIGLSISVSAQKQGCINDFNYLVNKIKADYPGYNDKVTINTGKDLVELELKLRNKITEHSDSCGKYLDDYVSWFKDGHLNVIHILNKNQSITDSNEKPMRKFAALNNDSIAVLSKKKNTIEGIWISSRGKIAIKKMPDENKYYGVVIKYEGYEQHQIIYDFTPYNEHQFMLRIYSCTDNSMPDRNMAYLLFDDKVLEMSDDNRFVRQSASAVYDNAFLASIRMQYTKTLNYYPVATYLDDSTYFLRITSFLDNQAETLIKPHWKEIMARPNLIIDIRNNTGGLDDYFYILLSLLYTNPYEKKGIEWYASEGNIKSFEETVKTGDVRDGEKGITWMKELIKAMKTNVGGFVIHPMMGGDSIIKEDTIYPYPKRVGIIINERNASAAEQFLLRAKESKKVILFGNRNTKGVLDYSNCDVEDFPSGNYQLKWPQSRSRRLPEHPIDNIGIAPDVVIPFPEIVQLYERIDDWVNFVKEYLEAMDEKE